MAKIRLDIDDIKSSNIAGMTFIANQDNDTFNSHSSITGTLIIEYSTGAVYKYSSVPFAVVLKVMSEYSIGSSIKKMLAGYGFEKVVNVNDLKKIES